MTKSMEEYGVIIIDALTKIAQQSVALKALNDSIGGELSRVMNSYSEIIHSEEGTDLDKDVWNKAHIVLQYCGVVEEDIIIQKELITDLLNTIAQI